MIEPLIEAVNPNILSYPLYVMPDKEAVRLLRVVISCKLIVNELEAVGSVLMVYELLCDT
jgi:hypothetical protein